MYFKSAILNCLKVGIDNINDEIINANRSQGKRIIAFDKLKRLINIVKECAQKQKTKQTQKSSSSSDSSSSSMSIK
jgi:hypothetical protein